MKILVTGVADFIGNAFANMNMNDYYSAELKEARYNP
jgi:nucleoside-diphosphate-sugar epimerase